MINQYNLWVMYLWTQEIPEQSFKQLVVSSSYMETTQKILPMKVTELTRFFLFFFWHYHLIVIVTHIYFSGQTDTVGAFHGL